MLKVISTQHGQLLAEIDKENGVTLILAKQGSTLTPVATVASVEKKVVMRAIRRIGTFLKLKATLDAINVSIHVNSPILERKATNNSLSENADSRRMRLGSWGK